MGDAELVAGILKGTIDFDVLFDRFVDRVSSWVAPLVKDSEDRRDVTICVLTTAWQKLDTYDPAKGSLCTWLYRMAKSLAYTFLRKKRIPIVSLDQMEGRREPVCEGPAPAHELAELKRLLWHAVAELPEPEQVVLELHYHDGYTWEEVAWLRGVSVRTAKFHGARGIALLQNKLRDARRWLEVL
jgi:RNA polymerase sigma factor (sigma-70 family)